MQCYSLHNLVHFRLFIIVSVFTLFFLSCFKIFKSTFSLSCSLYIRVSFRLFSSFGFHILLSIYTIYITPFNHSKPCITLLLTSGHVSALRVVQVLISVKFYHLLQYSEIHILAKIFPSPLITFPQFSSFGFFCITI